MNKTLIIMTLSMCFVLLMSEVSSQLTGNSLELSSLRTKCQRFNAANKFHKRICKRLDDEKTLTDNIELLLKSQKLNPGKIGQKRMCRMLAEAAKSKKVSDDENAMKDDTQSLVQSRNPTNDSSSYIKKKSALEDEIQELLQSRNPINDTSNYMKKKSPLEDETVFDDENKSLVQRQNPTNDTSGYMKKKSALENDIKKKCRFDDEITLDDEYAFDDEIMITRRSSEWIDLFTKFLDLVKKFGK